MTYPSVYPTGATLYDPERCWNGYTVFQAKEVGALLIDMNGGEVQLWKMLHGMPNRILPGGYIIGSTGERSTAFGSQDGIDLVQVDWDGNIVWRFNRVRVHRRPRRGAAVDGATAPRLPAGGQPGGLLCPGPGAPDGSGQHADPVPQEHQGPPDLRQAAARRHHHRSHLGGRGHLGVGVQRSLR